eukprot:1152030-Pelagomonas_calceolata.AAC.8
MTKDIRLSRLQPAHLQHEPLQAAQLLSQLDQRGVDKAGAGDGSIISVLWPTQLLPHAGGQ